MFARLHLRRSTIIAFLVALAMVATMSTAFAQYGPPSGSGHGTGRGGSSGGGGGGETTLTNNLSVPAIFANNTGSFGLSCGSETTPSALVAPDDQDVHSGYPIDTSASYYVQGLNTWQAQCYTTTDTVLATPAWGDNLQPESGASLKVNSPIRVEVALNSSGTMQGYKVVKLDPNALDRESAYGTLATPSGTGYVATPISFPNTETDSEGVAVTTNVRVYDGGGAKLSIVPQGNDPSFQDVTAEINATGAVVYGYNWRPTTAGWYTLSFQTSSYVDLDTTGNHTTSIDVYVAATAGGSGGSGGNG